jgi:hypothetical protein
MSYYVYTLVVNSNDDYLTSEYAIERDAYGHFVRFKSLCAEDKIHHPMQFSGEDYEFLKNRWNEHFPDTDYDFETPFKLSKQLIEDWELFKKDCWYDNYGFDEHEENIRIMKSYMKDGNNVYLNVG